MDEYQDQSTNGQVIVGAGIAAAVLAAIALFLSRRKEKPKTPAERVGETIDTTLHQARDAGQRLLAQAEASPELERAGKEARRWFERGNKASHDLAKDLEARTARLGKEARHSGDQAATSAQHIAAQAAAAAVERAERALELGTQLAEAAREQGPRVAHRVETELLPVVRDIATQAADAAMERLHEARERAAEINPAELRHLEQRAAHLATAGGELARGTGLAVADRAADISRRAAEATEHTVDRARDATKKGADAASHARDAAGHAKDATVETGKDTGAMLFWAGAAAGLVFYALLSAERRQQISQTIQEFVKDIQGYDDEF